MGFLGLASCGPMMNGTEKVEKIHKGEGNPKLSVLFVGNSYSFGVPRAFSRLARAEGRKVSVKRAAIGGWSLEKHMTQPETLERLHSRKWDVVVIQDHSLNPASSEENRRKVMDPGVKFFADAAREMGAVPLLYQTWGRRDGWDEEQGQDFYEMNERVRNGYRNAADAAGVEIVPVGDAWEQEFRAGRGENLYVEDGSHPSDEGDKVSAREFYRVIFGEES